MKQQVIAMKKHPGRIEFDGIEFPLALPKGCTGIVFCFESKKAARKYWGKDVDLIGIAKVEDA